MLPFIYQAQSLNSTSGLINTPSAKMNNDGTVVLGVNYLHKSLVSFGGYTRDAISPFVNFTFLPFFEASFSITNVEKTGNSQGIGDRTISIKLQPIDQSYSFINLSVGVQNISTAFGGEKAIHNHAVYAVIGKQYDSLFTNFTNFNINAGYGAKVFKGATSYSFQGLFSGIEIKFFETVSLMTEYESERINAGLKLSFLRSIHLLAVYTDLKYFSGGISYSLQL